MNAPIISHAPPAYALAPHVETVALLIFSAFSALTIIFVLWRARQDRSMVPVYFLIGGLLSAVYEPFADVLTLAVPATINVVPGFALLGRNMPIYELMNFVFYFAPAIIVLHDKFRAGMTGRQLDIIFIGLVLFSFVYEIPTTHFGLWTYYGPYSLMAGKFPAVFGFINAANILGLAVILYYARPHIPPKYEWSLIGLTPIVVFGTGFSAALPTAAALLSSTNGAIITLGSLLSVAISVGLFCFYRSLILGVKP